MAQDRSRAPRTLRRNGFPNEESAAITKVSIAASSATPRGCQPDDADAGAAADVHADVIDVMDADVVDDGI
jgi:hypothetical protein